jgi:integrase/recombinase XerD
MNAKFKAFLFPQPYSNGEYPIYIRIYKDRKSSYVSSGYSIPAGAWNPDKAEVWESKPSLTAKLKETLSGEELKAFKKKQASIILLPNAFKMNADIRKKIGELEKLQNKLEVNGEAITSGKLKSKHENRDLIENSRKDFLKYIEEISKRKFDMKQIRTSEKYSVMLRKLKKFRNDKPLPIDELTTSFLNDFQLYLQKDGKHINYIHINLKALRTIIQKEAIKEDKILSPEKNPFIYFDMPKVLPTKKERLDIKEIQKLEGLDLEETDFLFHVRNAFLFSLYNAGIRIGDLMQLKWCNIKEGRLEYSMGKTDKLRNTKLLPQAIRILAYYQPSKKKESDYIFPFLDNNADYSKIIGPEDFQKASSELIASMFKRIEVRIAQCNAGLKLIAMKAGIKKRLTNHISRHSFAEIARKKGISIYDISGLLGHSSIKITQGYLKSLDNDSMDKAMAEVFN